MVESIVRHWKRQLAPLRHLRQLTSHSSELQEGEDENWQRRLLPQGFQDGLGHDRGIQDALPAKKHMVTLNQQVMWWQQLLTSSMASLLKNRKPGKPSSNTIIELQVIRATRTSSTSSRMLDYRPGNWLWHETSSAQHAPASNPVALLLDWCLRQRPLWPIDHGRQWVWTPQSGWCHTRR